MFDLECNRCHRNAQEVELACNNQVGVLTDPRE